MPLTTDPLNPDTDGDGLLDGEEIDQTISWKRVINDTGDGSHKARLERAFFDFQENPEQIWKEISKVCSFLMRKSS